MAPRKGERQGNGGNDWQKSFKKGDEEKSHAIRGESFQTGNLVRSLGNSLSQRLYLLQPFSFLISMCSRRMPAGSSLPKQKVDCDKITPEI